MDFIEKNRKKIIIGIVVVAFLALVGAVQVIRVVGGNISKAVNGETKVESNGDITSLSSSDAQKIVDDAEKELKAKEELAEKQRKENEAYKQELNKKDEEYKNNQVQLPSSDIVPNTNFNRQATRGVAKVNGNYYVGYYCGLKEVWKAVDKAQTNAIMLKTMVERGESKSSEDYQMISAKVKGQTPYIKEIQDIDMKTADPNKMVDIIDKYMEDTVRMNCRYIDTKFYYGLINEAFGTNEHFYIAANPKGTADHNFKLDASVAYLNKLDNDKYPALNENILE